MVSGWDRAVLDWSEHISGPLRSGLRMVGSQFDSLQVYMLLVGIGILVVLQRSGLSLWFLYRPGAEATGTVLTLDDTGDGTYATIRFRDADGRDRTFTTNVSTDARHVGQRIAIVYDPKNSRRAREAGRSVAWIAAVIGFYGAAAVCLVFGFGLLPTELRR